MKSRHLFFAMAFTLFFNAGVCWAEPAGMGNYHWAVKVEYLEFTHDIDKWDVDNGEYFGIEFFGRLFDHLYLGGEVGYFDQRDNADVSSVFPISTAVNLTYVPVELNLKYIVNSYRWTWAVGGGASYNYVDFDASDVSSRESEDGWFWGGQVFMDLYLVGDLFFAGINGKYQFVEEDFDNWRLGGQAGFHF